MVIEANYFLNHFERTMENYQNQTALITGASSGIGYELAKLFAQDRFNLVIVARGENRLYECAQEFQRMGAGQVTVIAKDLSVVGAGREVYEETQRQGITIDVLVNDAGQGQRGNFIDYPFERDVEIINLNIISLVELTKYYVKDMVARNRGRVLMLSSIASTQPNPLLAVYAATKAFVQSFTDALINELKDTEVTVTALLPNATETDFFNKAEAENVKATEVWDQPEEVAKAGYKALLAGNHRAYANFKTQIMAGMNIISPNEATAAMGRKLMEEKGE
jgi:uncharacterized protein